MCLSFVIVFKRVCFRLRISYDVRRFLPSYLLTYLSTYTSFTSLFLLGPLDNSRTQSAAQLISILFKKIDASAPHADEEGMQ